MKKKSILIICILVAFLVSAFTIFDLPSKFWPDEQKAPENISNITPMKAALTEKTVVNWLLLIIAIMAIVIIIALVSIFNDILKY